MEWLEIDVRVPAEDVEAVSDILIEMGNGGVVIEDPALILQYESETHPDEWAVPGRPKADGPVHVKAYLPFEDDESALVGKMLILRERLTCMSDPLISYSKVAEEDWAEVWKKYYKPVRVGQKLVIKPSWEDYRPLAGDLVIEMDPGMAFGCGTHATTALCLKLLEKYVRLGVTVYDIGTGSGILALAAARLGAGRVLAADTDPVACRTAAENVERNNAGGIVSVTQGSLAELAAGGADLIVANIIADVIAGLAPGVAAALRPGGIFIASGIILDRAEMVRSALAAAGLTICEAPEDGLWVALAAKKE